MIRLTLVLKPRRIIMNIKKTLSIIIAFIISFVVIQPIDNCLYQLSASAAGILEVNPPSVTDGELKYLIYSDHAVLSSCNKNAEGEIKISKTISNVPVTQINTNAFSSCDKITSITIPDSVSSIGDSAFENCKKLVSVNIPNSVTNIGRNAFDKTLLLLKLQEDNPLVIINHILIDGKECSENVEIPNNVKIIGDGAFSSCDKITSVTIPDSVVSIGKSAFENCVSLSLIKIPDSVVSIGYAAFSNTPWFINLMNDNTLVIINHILVAAKTDLETIEIPNDVKIIGEGSFEGSSLTSIIIPESVTSIGNSAFYNSSLTSITLHENLKNIGKNAFAKSGITSILIPKRVTSIDERAFYYCKKLKSIIIKNEDCVIYDHCTTICSSLGTIQSNKDGIIYNYGFGGIIEGREGSKAQAYAQKKGYTFYALSDGDFTDVIEDEIKYRIYSDHVEVVGYITPPKDLLIKDNINGLPVTIIRNLRFIPCQNITLPSSVEYIDEKTFYNCNLKTITIPNRKCKIYDNSLTICNTTSNIITENGKGLKGVFSGTIYCYEDSTAQAYAEKYGYYYEKLKEDKFYDKMQDSIMYRIYSNHAEIISCSSDLEGELIIPSKIDDVPVTYINRSAFNKCSLLIKIILPENMVYIGDLAFSGCTGLSNIVLDKQINSIGKSAFSGCSNLSSITIPDSILSISQSTFSGCTNLDNIKLNNGLKYIGESAFSGCSNLSSITIPDSVLSIDKTAFGNCAKLESIKIMNKDCEIYDSPDTIYNSSKIVDSYLNKEYYFEGIIYGYKGSTAKQYAFFTIINLKNYQILLKQLPLLLTQLQQPPLKRQQLLQLQLQQIYQQQLRQHSKQQLLHLYHLLLNQEPLKVT